MDTRTLTADVPAALADKVDCLAKWLGRSKNSIVEQALQDWVLREEECYRLTLEALDDVDNGRLVNHHEVIAWADSLSTDRLLPLPES